MVLTSARTSVCAAAHSYRHRVTQGPVVPPSPHCASGLSCRCRGDQSEWQRWGSRSALRTPEIRVHNRPAALRDRNDGFRQKLTLTSTMLDVLSWSGAPSTGKPLRAAAVADLAVVRRDEMRPTELSFVHRALPAGGALMPIGQPAIARTARSCCTRSITAAPRSPPLPKVSRIAGSDQ